MKKITVTPSGVKAIFLFASLIPIYIAVYVTLGGDVFLSIFFTVFLIVIVSHLYYGYKWAKYTVALISLAFAAAQFFILKMVFTDWRVLSLLLVCVLLIINTLLLLRANAVSVFLSQQTDERTQKVLLLLKISRWILYALLVFGIAKDLLRLAT
jgi:hypothetical protein